MKKTFLEKISDKHDLDQSVYLEDDEEEPVTITIVEDQINFSDIKYKISKSINKTQKSFKTNFGNESILKMAGTTNSISNNSNESIVSLEVDKINHTFMKKFASASSKKSDKNLKYREIYLKGDEMFNSNNEQFEIKEENEENFFSPKQQSKEDVFMLPKKKEKTKIFEEFLTIGIESSGLEYLNDHDELFMTPKILYNYPNQLQENELKFNIKFLKNFCFNEGVKVTKYIVSEEEDYIQKILEKNFFSKHKLSFCLVQQITTEDVEKYFIFGIKFDDFYIIDSKLPNTKNIFVYEKTYLFISNNPLCRLFDVIFQHILNLKKLNFFKNLDNFDLLFEENNILNFEKVNNEKGEQISEVLKYFYERSYPKFEEYIGFKSEINHLFLNYYHPNKYNEEFLAIDWLSKIFFKLVDANSFYTILVRILLEQSFIFICENIQSLTTLVLGFSILIKPFSWPFILIPNLPLDLLSMVESPVPFILGILGDKNTKTNFANNPNITSNIVLYSNNKLELHLQEKLPCEEPYLKNLKNIITNNLSNAHYYLNSKITDEYEKYCETLYKNIYETLKYELADPIERQVKNLSFTDHITTQNTLELSHIHLQPVNTNNLNDNSFFHTNTIKSNFSTFINDKDISFGTHFSQTQIFQCYCEELRKKEFDNFDYI